MEIRDAVAEDATAGYEVLRRSHCDGFIRDRQRAVAISNMIMARMIPSCGIVVALGLGLTACTNPYDPVQQAIGGGLIGAGAGAAIGAAAGGGPGAALGAAIGGAVGVLGGAASTPPPGYYGYPPYSYPGFGYGGYSGYPAPAYWGYSAPTYSGYPAYLGYQGYPGYGYPAYGYPCSLPPANWSPGAG